MSDEITKETIVEPTQEQVFISETTVEPVVEPAVGSDTVGTELVNEVLTPNTTNQEPVSVSAEPVGDVIIADTEDSVESERAGEVQRPYSLDPKLNKMIEGFVRSMNRSKENLVLAHKAINARMMRRVYKVMDLFKKKRKVKNNDVEKFLHTNDTTATKYLNILTKEGKVKREGENNKTYYTKVE